jgi:tripartite-type tricarboxylate transporter receptor subunit TctC
MAGGSCGAQPADGDPAPSFPAKPIRMVVGFTPGGLPDITARLIGPKLFEVWKQQVVVDNRPGAGGIIATDIVAKANPDGYTLLSASSSHAATPAVRAKLPYDTLKDFAAITLTSRGAYVLVVAPALGVKSVQDLIALAKATPGQLNFASAGAGSGTHFAVELFKDLAHIDVVHVTYKGIPEALTEAVAGRVQFFMPPLASAAALIKDGRLIALAMSTRTRVARYADIPTIAESGLPGYE